MKTKDHHFSCMMSGSFPNHAQHCSSLEVANFKNKIETYVTVTHSNMNEFPKGCMLAWES
jgi:hypothetical protein